MKLHQIIGLTETAVSILSYQTCSNDSILTDGNGRGITKKMNSIEYLMYTAFENSYYAIHLSTYDCASFSGKLCSKGVMKISHSTYADVYSTMTHAPLKPLYVCADFEAKEYDWDESMNIYSHNEPHTCVFQFDGVGGDEKEPHGHVHVNMELFKILM